MKLSPITIILIFVETSKKICRSIISGKTGGPSGLNMHKCLLQQRTICSTIFDKTFLLKREKLMELITYYLQINTVNKVINTCWNHFLSGQIK